MMAQFEEALADLESSVAEAQKRADALTKSLRRVLHAARSGNVQQIERGLAQLPALGTDAAAAVGELSDHWRFDVRAYLEDGYLDELSRQAAEAGLSVFERDGRIYAFPLIMRLIPAEAAVRIAKRTERGIRPKALVRQLAAFQKRPQRLIEQRFLDLLYRAYQRLAGSDWRRIERGPGPAMVLAEMHEVLTLLPGADYPLEEFGRDLLLLDRQPDLRSRDGSAFAFAGSTLGRTAKRVTIYDELGNSREFIAIQFVKEA